MIFEYEAVRSVAMLSRQVMLQLELIEDKWKPELPPTTVAFGEIGHYVAQNVDRLPDTELIAILDNVETLLLEGDQETRSAVATGFLEALLAESSAKQFDFSKVDGFLGKESKSYCREWDRFTGVQTKGLT